MIVNKFSSAELSALIASDNIQTASQAMILVGEISRPTAEIIEAVRKQARCVVRVAETIDPTKRFSTYILYERILDLARGVMAAAKGLSHAGVDLRAELRAMAEACGPRESAAHPIQTGCERIIGHFDELEKSSETPATKGVYPHIHPAAFTAQTATEVAL